MTTPTKLTIYKRPKTNQKHVRQTYRKGPKQYTQSLNRLANFKNTNQENTFKYLLVQSLYKK